MDLLGIATRGLFAYVMLLVLVRAGGKRLLRHATPFDFTLALVLGDMVDDLVFGEIAAITFVTAAGVLVLMHLSIDRGRIRLGRSGAR
jgi:uncharacterized membrane protein YcaP (DUF421 family)